MVSTIKSLIIVALLAALAACSSERNRTMSDIEVATYWCNSLSAGDVEQVVAFSAVPFDADGDIAYTLDELEAMFDKVVEEKGIRTDRVVDVTTSLGESETNFGLPEDSTVVLLHVGGKRAWIGVRDGSVVGIRD